MIWWIPPPERSWCNGNQPLTEEILVKMKQKGISEVECLVLDAPGVSSTIRDTMLLDKIDDERGSGAGIYRKMRPSSPPTQEVASNFFNGLFFNISTYDLSPGGTAEVQLPARSRMCRWTSGPFERRTSPTR